MTDLNQLQHDVENALSGSTLSDRAKQSVAEVFDRAREAQGVKADDDAATAGSARMRAAVTPPKAPEPEKPASGKR
jgi:hypothetical protein